MRTFVAILRILGYALSLALLAYFVVREMNDPWLVERFLGTSPTETVVAAEPAEVVVPPEPEPVIVDEAEPLAFDAAATQATLEDELVRTQAALAHALEAKLMHNMDRVRGAYDERGKVMGEVRETVGDLVAELEREGTETAKDTAEAIAGIETHLAALSESDAALDHSLEQWSDAFRSLTEVEKISSEALDERNYEFVEYAVGSSETLAEIAQKLAREYKVENIDLGTLIPMFNEIEMRSRNLGTRRGTIRVVANDTLRIPLPKSSGELLADQQLGERMQAQRATIVGAKQRQATVRAELGGQIQRLRQTVQRVEGLRELTRLMSSSLETLDPTDTLEVIGDEANEAQRVAWDAFNAAYREYRQSLDGESQRAAKDELEQATRALFDAYISSDSSSSPVRDAFSDSDSGDLDWLQQFIDRYEPRSVKEIQAD